MMNQLIMIGRLTKDVEIEKVGEKEIAKIKIACTRSYKNVDGEYDTDFITCTLFQPIAENVKEYCKKGDILGIKGRIQSDGEKMEVIAEKVTFLSSKKESEEK